ncbi:nucleoside hydrolase [Janibacter cremeus]|uniref:Purine nucleosidase n=1 Tax=Janibacter cremeus TaxID=1285192 RepID=A0A852VRW5_9MICO|nr:nucleoside hydrolase [Janibacter cremeus]NYF97443.1 purine nucleosidase [Janibacter cremeus]
MPLNKPVIVDTDTGVDDALALMLLLSRRDIEVISVHSTHGNCTAERAAGNARYVLETCGFADVPVHVGRGEPLGQKLQLSSRVHGDDGFGNTWREPRQRAESTPDAVTRLVELARDRPGELHYLALGPVTNLAAALRQEPRLIEMLRTVTIVGSLGPAMYQDDQPWLDHRFRVSKDPNVSGDITAAAEVAAAKGVVTWVGPYITRQCLVPKATIDEIAQATANPHARLIADISHFYADFYTKAYRPDGGPRVMGINDSIAAACLLEPEVLLASVHRPLQVFHDQDGVSYLAGVHPERDDTRVRHEIVFDVDFTAIIDMVTQALRTPQPWRT